MSADPVLIAYAVKYSKKAKRNYWYRIGKAYPHSNGSGLNVVLDAVPINGRIVLLELNDWDQKRLAVEPRKMMWQENPRN